MRHVENFADMSCKGRLEFLHSLMVARVSVRPEELAVELVKRGYVLLHGGLTYALSAWDLRREMRQAGEDEASVLDKKVAPESVRQKTASCFDVRDCQCNGLFMGRRGQNIKELRTRLQMVCDLSFPDDHTVQIKFKAGAAHSSQVVAATPAIIRLVAGEQPAVRFKQAVNTRAVRGRIVGLRGANLRQWEEEHCLRLSISNGKLMGWPTARLLPSASPTTIVACHKQLQQATDAAAALVETAVEEAMQARDYGARHCTYKSVGTYWRDVNRKKRAARRRGIRRVGPGNGPRLGRGPLGWPEHCLAKDVRADAREADRAKDATRKRNQTAKKDRVRRMREDGVKVHHGCRKGGQTGWMIDPAVDP